MDGALSCANFSADSSKVLFLASEPPCERLERTGVMATRRCPPRVWRLWCQPDEMMRDLLLELRPPTIRARPLAEGVVANSTEIRFCRALGSRSPRAHTVGWLSLDGVKDVC